jgi:hypothetical protein
MHGELQAESAFIGNMRIVERSTRSNRQYAIACITNKDRTEQMQYCKGKAIAQNEIAQMQVAKTKKREIRRDNHRLSTKSQERMMALLDINQRTIGRYGRVWYGAAARVLPELFPLRVTAVAGGGECNGFLKPFRFRFGCEGI